MNKNPFTSIFLRVRDQYSAAVRWSYFAIILLLFFHLISIGPFVELNRRKTQTELDKKRLSGVKSQIEILASGFKYLQEYNFLELDKRLGGLVQNLRDDFTRINLTVEDLREKAKTESELLPERIKLLIPYDLREIHESILSASILFKSIKELHGIPEKESELPKEAEDQLREQLKSPEFRERVESALEENEKTESPEVQAEKQARTVQEPLFQITDPDLLKKIKFTQRREELLKALKPFVEENIIEPEYLKLNKDWKEKILPAIQTQFENLTKEMKSARSKFPEGLNRWEELAASLKTKILAASNLKFKPPTEPTFWWSTVEEKEQVRIGLKDEIASWLQQGPPVLISLREHVSTLLYDQEESGKKTQIEISKLEEQFKVQQNKLASLAKPLRFIALELNSIIGLFPLLLGLIFATLTVWTTLCLHELGRIIRLIVKQGADPLLWDWYCAQVFLLLPKPSTDITEQSKSSLIRKSIGLCTMFWMWIGIAAWRLHGIGEIEPRRLVVVTCIGATVVALAQVHRYVLLNSTLSLKATQATSVVPSSQE